MDKDCNDIFDEKNITNRINAEADSIIVIWPKLLCLLVKLTIGCFYINDKIPYTDEMLATIFRRKVNTVKLALDTFVWNIKIINNVITIPNWSKHQSLTSWERKEYEKYMRSTGRNKNNCRRE